MRRHRRHRRYDDDYYDSSILLAEFRFYNNRKKLIDDKILTDIQKQIIEGKRNRVYWTSDEFSKHNVGFEIFKKKNLNEQTDVYIEIMEFPFLFTTEEFNKCRYIIQKKLFLTFDLTHEQVSLLNSLTIKSLKDSTFKGTIDKWEDVLNILIKDGDLKSYASKDEYEWDAYKTDMKILFGEVLVKPKYSIQKDDAYYTSDTYHIFKVIEKRIDEKNYRVAFISDFGSSTEGYMIDIIGEDSEDYNYIDEGRIYIKGENTYFLDIATNKYIGDATIINYDLFKQMRNNISDVLGKKKIITPTIYRFYNDKVMAFEYFNGKDMSEKEQAIIQQYQKLLDEGKKIKVDKLIITKNSIKIDGEGFVLAFDDEFLDVNKCLYSMKQILKDNDVRYNFNILYENLLKLSKLKVISMKNAKEEDYKEFTDTQYKVNDIDIKITKINNRIKINDIFCRIKDVFYILSKAICYNNNDDFNKYVKDVSYIGADWKKMISNGVSIELDNPFFDILNKIGRSEVEKLFLRFSLLWDIDNRRNVYLILNKKQYLIKYKTKFKRYFNLPSQSLSMEGLKFRLNDCLEKIDDNMIIEIVHNAIEEAKIIKERGEQLVKETISEIGAKETEVKIKGGKIFGYEFTGRLTGSKYVVDKADLEVYKWMEGSWNRRCVIDDHSKQRIFEDRLANRLVNIYNEPKKIFTLYE